MRKKKLTDDPVDRTPEAKQVAQMYVMNLNPELTTHYELCMLMNAFGYQIPEEIYNLLPTKLKANFVVRT